MAVVTFLSDYGLSDDFVGVCHGVIARIAPDARVIDISHGIARHEVRSGALMLRRSLHYMPPGVHLAVVDPGVGSERRAIALRCAGDEQRVLVGPDNGLLTLAAEHFGGIAEARRDNSDSTPAALATRCPAARAARTSSSADLPTPASPRSTSTRLSPAPTDSSSPSSTSRSCSRPSRSDPGPSFHTLITPARSPARTVDVRGWWCPSAGGVTRDCH